LGLIDLAAMRKVAVHLVVGAADIETWHQRHRPHADRAQYGADAQSGAARASPAARTSCPT
jgi:hypothetical protein